MNIVNDTLSHNLHDVLLDDFLDLRAHEEEEGDRSEGAGHEEGARAGGAVREEDGSRRRPRHVSVGLRVRLVVLGSGQQAETLRRCTCGLAPRRDRAAVLATRAPARPSTRSLLLHHLQTIVA